ncbi:MAG: hypothetical protein AAGA18_10795 [Verrucomicrobiota bacterium]
MKKILALAVIAHTAMLFTSPLQAIIWDSETYTNTNAIAFAASKTWKIGYGANERDGSAVKVARRWIGTSKFYYETNSFVENGRTYSVERIVTSRSSDARLYKVKEGLPPNRRSPTASNLQVGDQFKKLGLGYSSKVPGNVGPDYLIFDLPGIWRGGRNEVDSIDSVEIFLGNTDIIVVQRSVKYQFDKNYSNEVAIFVYDIGGPAAIGAKLVGTSTSYESLYHDADWTRLESWWQKYL